LPSKFSRYLRGGSNGLRENGRRVEKYVHGRRRLCVS
jgi:hypothetical protein